ncbi:hypothetical protein L873DRAFT_1830136 [Choiromyces venosus 120613-1]|uniref:Uncharacterized protein n=1 Tax=Choiromyces venosus 120613-1 TaxID=1336337 RepID=A0A3N4J929_9PEZI|nr:hypothetical protein L873DRAFT_1830136 [Choiromyces venosus 120613-1]
MTLKASGTGKSKKALKILDRLSFLLVTDIGNDEAAISVSLGSTDHIELWYSKNRPCTKTEKTNLVAFVRAALTATPPERLLRTALYMCERQVHFRMLRACQFLSGLSQDDHLGVIPRASSDDTEIRDKAKAQVIRMMGKGAIPPNRDLESYLYHLFRTISVARFVAPHGISANVEYYFETVIQCHVVVHLVGIETVIIRPLLHHLRKIGEYYTAVFVASSELNKLSPAGKLYLFDHIQEIPPSTSPTTFTPLLPHTCLGNWTLQHNIPPPCPPPYHYLLQAPNHQVTECTHPEATLIQKIITSSVSSSSQFTVQHLIGTSRKSCWMCREFLAAACTLHSHISIRMSTGKTYTASTWKFPQGTSGELEVMMRTKVDIAMMATLDDYTAGGVKRKWWDDSEDEDNSEE